jgi:xanthine dehydrogenase accessory factor
LEAATLTDGQIVMNKGAPRLVHYCLTEEGAEAIGILRGGEIHVFFQPYFPPPKLIIVGGGHIGRPLKIMGKAAGYDVIIVDIEPGRATALELEAVPMGEDSYVGLIATDHGSDEAALRYAITTPAPYIGMIGSRHKCQTILEHLQVDGFSKNQLARIYAPIGLNLGGSSPAEIAMSILADVVARRHEKNTSFRGSQ